MAGRVSQEPVEAIISPTSESGRVSQEVAEALIAPTSEAGRLSQVVIEGVLFPTDEIGRISQVVIEVLVHPVAADVFPPLPIVVPPVPVAPVSLGGLQALTSSPFEAVHDSDIWLGKLPREIWKRR